MATKLILGLGLCFEMPILVFFLARLGIVSERWLLAKFKYAVLIIFVIAAVITPTPDIATQCVFAVPMIALYLIGILIAYLFRRRDAAPQESDYSLVRFVSHDPRTARSRVRISSMNSRTAPCPPRLWRTIVTAFFGRRIRVGGAGREARGLEHRNVRLVVADGRDLRPRQLSRAAPPRRGPPCP